MGNVYIAIWCVLMLIAAGIALLFGQTAGGIAVVVASVLGALSVPVLKWWKRRPVN